MSFPFGRKYVPKTKRVQVDVESGEEEIDEKAIIQRKRESKKLAKKASRETNEKTQIDIIPFAEPEAPDINDYQSNPEEEYQLWVQREIERIREEVKEYAKMAYDQAKTEQQHSMDDATLQKIKEENRPARGHMKYMQKYYHKGAFSIDDSEKAQELLSRDFTEAVGDDRYDKTLLPEAMVVRGGDYLKKGRSKWTHLSNEDTTTYESRLAQRIMAGEYIKRKPMKENDDEKQDE